MYKLERYRSKTQKHECPKCGKRSFVRYVDDAGNILNGKVGRCDREDNCGYHYKPKEWLRDNPNAKVFESGYVQERKYEAKKSPGYIPISYIIQSAESRNNSLVFFLLDLFPHTVVSNITGMYFLGSTKNHAVIFPQIDSTGKCRTGKIQAYDKSTGKRLKSPGSVDWIHSRLKKSGVISNDYNLQQCLFGLHLIRSNNNAGKTVCIVESEKTAIIAAGTIPEYLWMAAGALNGLSVEKIKPLKDRKIILFPDTSETGSAKSKWQKIADEAKAKGYDIAVSNLLEDNTTETQKKAGYDLADYLIDMIKNKRSTQKPGAGTASVHSENDRVLNHMINKNPALQLLIDKLDLKFC